MGRVGDATERGTGGHRETEKNGQEKVKRKKGQGPRALNAVFPGLSAPHRAVRERRVNPELNSLAPSFHFHPYLNAHPAPNLFHVLFHADLH